MATIVNSDINYFIILFNTTDYRRITSAVAAVYIERGVTLLYLFNNYVSENRRTNSQVLWSGQLDT